MSSSSTSSAQPRPVRALLVDRTFGPWFVGLLFSNSGNWLYNVTAAVVVFNITGSAFLVGLVTVAQFASLATLSLWAGALSDRFDRRRIALASQGFAGVIATGMAVAAVQFGAESLPGGEWAVIAATLGIGVGIAFATPSQQALVPALVDDVDLEAGIALTSLTFNMGRALGPAAGGVLLATLGPDIAFVVNAASFLPLLLALTVIRAREKPRRTGGDRSVRAAIRHVRNDPALVGLLLGVAAVGIATDPVNTLSAPLAARLEGGDELVAFLVSTFGVGAVTIALVVGRLQRAFGNLSVAFFGATTLGLGLLVTAFAPVAFLALLGFLVAGMGFLLGLTSFTSSLQRRVEDEIRGRVMALWSVAFLGTRPIGAIIDGALADLVGVRSAFVFPIAVAFAGAYAAVRVRRLETSAAVRSDSVESQDDRTGD